MKKVIVFSLIICSVSLAIAQKKNYQKITAITKTEFDKHLPAVDLITKAKKEYKTKGKIKIKTINKTIILKDDGEMREYRCEGELKGSNLIIIHEFEPNSEEYYLINKQTGKIDTLLDKPIFHPNNQDFICLEGEGTDVHQRIQIGRIEHGNLINNQYIKELPLKVHPSRIYWFNTQALYIDDNDQKFYKLILFK